MDKYRGKNDQGGYVISKKFPTYVIATVVAFHIRRLYLNEFWIFIFFGNIWLPQIIKNTINEHRNAPNIWFIIV